MLDDRRQVLVQERLAAVEADIEYPGLLAVLQQIADEMERQHLAGHEVAPVATTDAPLVAVGRQRDENRIRPGRE